MSVLSPQETQDEITPTYVPTYRLAFGGFISFQVISQNAVGIQRDVRPVNQSSHVGGLKRTTTMWKSFFFFSFSAKGFLILFKNQSVNVQSDCTISGPV